MKRHLNLIPPAIQRRQAAKRILRGWSSIVTFVGIICLSACVMEWSRGVAAVQRLQALDARFAPLGKLADEERELTGIVENLRAREELSLRLSTETEGVTLLGAVSTAAKDLGDGIYLVEFRFQGDTPLAGGAKPGSRSLRLEGAGIDGLAIASFADRLRDAGVFSTVSVGATRPVSGGAPTLRSFQIDCVF